MIYRRIIFWTFSVALLGALVLFVLEKSQVTNFYTKPINTASLPVTGGPTNVIDNPIDTNTSTGTDTSSDKYASPNKESGTDKPINSDTISGEVNYKSVTADNLSLRVTIYQTISGGDCSLKLTRTSDGKQITKTAKVIANPSSATCGGFDIPLSEVGPGKWNIAITVTSGVKTGQITDEVSI